MKDNSEFIDSVNAIVDRREQAKNFKMHCPVCQTEQVQLLRWSNNPEWIFRCRHCKSQWEVKMQDERKPINEQVRNKK